MIARSSGITRTVVRADDLLAWLAATRAPRLDVVVDPAVRGQEAVEGLLAAVVRSVPEAVVLSQAATEGADELSARMRADAAVVAVGGGSVLDSAKLAVRLGAGDCGPHLSVPHRSAMVLLPPLPRAARALAAVPTTIGTGSEVSKAAVHTGVGRRRLVVGEGLQPDLALHDPALTSGLPAPLVAEGVVEILARLLGPCLGDPRPRTVEDAVARALLGVLAPLVAETAVLGAALPPGARADLLRIGALSHQDALVSGRSPYAVKWWALTNEICACTGARKVPVLVAVLPVVLARMQVGDLRWGSARRLEELWAFVAEATGVALPAEPVEGVRALLGRLGLHGDPAVRHLDVDAVARRVHRAWGAGLPMFAGFAERELADLVLAVTREAGAPAPTGSDVDRRPAVVTHGGTEGR
ncbi:daptide-type RiPP biosynthesis dehydogenase [Georgenia faecalis]|uniref:daptide-type RiPP biosynthesis dehydogenase n=1 Tax=Georgenia faecalis TaxID=2483799 RepID=UPI000FDB88F9|nr:daptide-type RiPP biosynthesis dehydogenase [Georgenia faecalis]